MSRQRVVQSLEELDNRILKKREIPTVIIYNGRTKKWNVHFKPYIG